MAYPNPPDTGPGQPQPRAISASFSRPGSTIDDLMARFSSPNPNPAPPTMSSPFSAGSQHHLQTGNGSAMVPPPPGMGMGGYTSSSMFSPGGMMMSPPSHGGPSPVPMYGVSNGSVAGLGGAQGGSGENRQSQLLDLLRSAGQTPVGMPSSPTPSGHLYPQFGLGSGQPQPPQHSYGQHHHPAMQQNNSFSGLPSTGVNRVVSPTQGLSAGAGTTQAQNLLAALINGTSTPVSPAPVVQEIPFSIHQPVIVDQQGSAPIEQPNGLLRADTFGNLNKHVSSDEGVASGSDRQGSEKQTISDVQHVEVEETLHTAPIKTTATASLPAETTTPVPEPSKTTAAFFSSFVSPFDAFDPPPPTMTANSTSGPDGANSKKKSKKDKAAVKIGEKAVAAELKNTKVPAPKAASENVEKKEKAAQASVLASESRGSTQTTTSIPVNTLPLPAKKPVKQEDIPVVYRSSAFIDPSQPTSAATIPAAEWLYDMSEPHADSLVHIPKPYEERRISNIKTHVMTTGLSAGSVLRASVNLLAYVLPKGKARVVNQDTAGNTLIALADFGDNSSQPPSQQQPVAVIDLALTDKWVVLLGEDGSFGVWRVDTGSDGQSMACHPEFFRGVSARGREVKRVDLIDVNGVVTLVMMTDEMVASVAVEELAEANEADDWIQLMDVTYEETFSGLMDLDISLEREEIAVVTRSGEFCVYSLNKAQPVAQGVHRPTDNTWITSVRILGENLLIGSSEGEFDLVAAHDSTAGKTAPIISKLWFKDHTKSINPEQALWMKPRVNEKERLLWIVSFSRASVFAIKYRDVQTNSQAGGRHRAFRKILEFPLEPLGDFTLDPCYSASFFFKDPKGFSQASVPKHLLDLLDESAEEDVDESGGSVETEESVAAPAVERAVEQDRPEPHLSKQDMNMEQSAKALDDNAADAISRVPQAPQAHEVLMINKDLATNKPGSGIDDADEAGQEPALHTQLSTADTNGNEYQGNTSSNLSAFDLNALQSSIAEHVQQSMASQLSSFSANQLSAVHVIRHDLLTQETERQQTLVTLVSDVIERDIKKSLQQIVSNQIDKKVVPLVTETLRQQTDKAFSSEIPAQINSALQDTVLSQVERSLIPHLGRTFTSTLSPIVERNVRTLISDNLVPQFMQSVDTISDELSAAIHREMLEVRKDVLVEQSTQLKSAEAMIQSMAVSMKTLIGQVSDLSEQVKELKVLHGQAQAQLQSRGPPPPPPMHQPMPPPPGGFPMMPTPQILPMAPHQQSFVGASPRNTGPAPFLAQVLVSDVPLSAARPNPSLAGAEEEFLNALMTMSDEELIGFIMARSDRTQVYLPAPGQQPCPLSQQVLLTMIHRLTKAMTPLPTATAEYQTLLRWIFRIAYLIDGKQPDIQDFFEPVKRALTTDYQSLIDRYAQQQDRSPATVQAVQAMVQIVQILASK